MKISTRLLLLFVLVSVLPLALFSYLNLQQDEVTLRAEALERLSGLADKKVVQIRSYLGEREREVGIRARGPQVMDAIVRMQKAYAAGWRNAAYAREETVLHQYFERYVEESEMFYDVFLITPLGEVIYSQKHEADFATNLLTGTYRESQLAWAFRAARMALEPVISGYEYYIPTQTPALFIAAPIMVDGQFRGVFAVQLGNELLYRVATDATGLGASGEAVFAQRDGESVLYTMPLKYQADAAMKLRMGRQNANQMFAAVSGESGEGVRTDYRGKPVAAAWRFLPELDWGMVVKIDADEVFAPVYRQRTLLLETLLGLLLFAGLVAYYFSRQISVPLDGLARTADEVAQGNLDKRADESAPGELGLFARAFNHMAENLQALYRTLEERIEERTRELNVTNEQLQEEVIEREQAEAALQNSKQQYDHLAANIPVGVYLLHTTPAGAFGFKYVSPQFCAMLGVAAEDVYRDGQVPFGAIHPDDLEEFVRLNRERVQAREPFLWEGRALVNGTVRWLRIESTPEPQENGDCMWDGLVTDITERQKAELALQGSMDRLNEAQRIAKVGNWELDLVGGHLYWSNEIFRLFEIDPAKFAATYEAFLNGIHPDDREKVNQAYTRSLETREPYEIAHRLLMVDGRIKWVNERCETIYDVQGKALRSIGTVQDITERQKTEDALQRSNTDLERFAYSVSHDMRQPLRAVSGHLQLLQRSLKDKLDEDERENLGFALEGARRMDSMIVSLLDYSRVGRKTEAKQWMESRVSLDEALGFLAPLIGDTKAQISVSGEWPQAFASRDELTRLFQNLIGNAIKFREAEQTALVEIDSSVHGETWRVSVRDHGVGINAQQIGRLFQFFSRLQSRTRFEGTGMGLALCRRIVEHHHGRIWVESEGEGKGSVFMFELPLNQAEGGAA